MTTVRHAFIGKNIWVLIVRLLVEYMQIVGMASWLKKLNPFSVESHEPKRNLRKIFPYLNSDPRFAITPKFNSYRYVNDDIELTPKDAKDGTAVLIISTNEYNEWQGVQKMYHSDLQEYAPISLLKKLDDPLSRLAYNNFGKKHLLRLLS